MKLLDKFLIVLWTVTALNGYAQTKQDSTKQLINTLQTSNIIHPEVEVVWEGKIPIEELDWNNWYPLGTVVIKKIDKKYIMNKLSKKYVKLYQTDTVRITIRGLDSLEKLVLSWEIKKWSRVWFRTNNKFITWFYVYEEPDEKGRAYIKVE